MQILVRINFRLMPIYIREKNLVSKQFMCRCSKNITLFIKNDIHILTLFLMITIRKSFAFVSQSRKIKFIFWYHDFLGEWEKLYCISWITICEFVPCLHHSTWWECHELINHPVSNYLVSRMDDQGSFLLANLLVWINSFFLFKQ